MSATTAPRATPAAEPTDPAPLPPRGRARARIQTLTHIVVGAAATWYLMLQLALLLRPLVLAMFLGYVLMPYHARLRRHVGAPASLAILATSSVGVLFGLAVLSYTSALALGDDLPRLQARAVELTQQAEGGVATHAPWLYPAGDGRPAHERVNGQIAGFAGPLLKIAADAALEACVVALYLLFILMEGARFPDRVRRAYSPERAAAILQIAGQVNSAIISYLKAKVKSSLVLAVPVGVCLWCVGVKFALLWAILTFLCNFIPYIGTVVAYTLPVSFAFLWFGLTWEPFAAAGLLLACHLGSSAVAEPVIIGNAVGVSPLVILASLAFWGLVWGLPGMFLAVPLTVVAILVMDHFESTRPVARLLRGG